MHSHMWAEIVQTGAVTAPGDARLQPLHISDTCSLDGVQTFNVTLPGRFATNGGRRRPWKDVLRVGDTIRVGAFNHGYAPETSAPRITADGLIVDVLPSEARSAKGYQLTTTLQCEGLQHVLMSDSVAWWMFYGALDGWLRARGDLLLDDLSGRLDLVTRNYLNRVAFHRGMWRRGGRTLGDRMGFDLRSLDPQVPAQVNLSIGEGSHWGIMQAALDPLHEFYVRPQPRGYAYQGVERHLPSIRETPNVVSEDAPDRHDDARAHVMLRPVPFPYALPGGQGTLGDWGKLALHDFTDLEPIDGAAMGTTLRAVRNYFLVIPNTQLLTEQLSFTVGIGVQNQDSVQRMSYRPLKISTNLMLDATTEEDFTETVRRLTWRLAGQHNRLDEMESGVLRVPLAPHVWPGDRVRFRAPLGDLTVVYEGYVTSRTHDWSREAGGTTSMNVERALPAAIYRDPSWFVRGLTQVTLPEMRPIAPYAGN